MIDFPILAELKAEGITDYLASPLFFSNGAVHVVTWTTRQSTGFTNTQVAALESLLAPLARLVEIKVLRREAINLLDT